MLKGRDIVAKGLFGHVVAGGLKRAGPAAATDFFIFTVTAFTG
jgi:hypothetical protein